MLKYLLFVLCVLFSFNVYSDSYRITVYHSSVVESIYTHGPQKSSRNWWPASSIKVFPAICTSLLLQSKNINPETEFCFKDGSCFQYGKVIRYSLLHSSNEAYDITMKTCSKHLNGFLAKNYSNTVLSRYYTGRYANAKLVKSKKYLLNFAQFTTKKHRTSTKDLQKALLDIYHNKKFIWKNTKIRLSPKWRLLLLDSINLSKRFSWDANIYHAVSQNLRCSTISIYGKSGLVKDNDYIINGLYFCDNWSFSLTAIIDASGNYIKTMKEYVTILASLIGEK